MSDWVKKCDYDNCGSTDGETFRRDGALIFHCKSCGQDTILELPKTDSEQLIGDNKEREKYKKEFEEDIKKNISKTKRNMTNCVIK